jgi:hypothetical protein
VIAIPERVKVMEAAALLCFQVPHAKWDRMSVQIPDAIQVPDAWMLRLKPLQN